MFGSQRVGLPTTRSWVRVPRKPIDIKKRPTWTTSDDNGATVDRKWVLPGDQA